MGRTAVCTSTLSGIKQIFKGNTQIANGDTVEPLNADTLGPAKSVLIREVSSELIHDPIALGLYKSVLNMEVFAFQGVHI